MRGCIFDVRSVCGLCHVENSFSHDLTFRTVDSLFLSVSRIAEGILDSLIRINSFGAADPNMPFGGVKDSGYGREHGGFGMKEFANAKAIFLP